jgi:hypothetical protein
MLRKFLPFLPLLLLLSLLLPALPTTHAQGSKPVVALYFAWYEQSDWATGQLSDLPPKPYSCGDQATLQRQIQQAHDAGIDAFMVAWTGQEDGRITGRVQQLLDIAGQYDFKIAVYLDITASHNWQTAEQVRENLRYAINTFASHPNYLRYNNRPVIGFWALGSVAPFPGMTAYDTWKQLRQELDPGGATFWLGEGIDFSYLDIFDGIYFFDITWAAEPSSAQASYSRKLNTYNSGHGTAKPFVATVMPGYDDTRMPNRQTHYRDRANGDYYRKSWQAAMDYQAAMVVITSWNEWYEGSQIEPSQSYGTQYLDITREKSPQFKSGAPPAPTQGPAPTAAPVGSFADSALESVWQRTDKPVADGRATRSWVWGPAPFTAGLYEPYAEAPGGSRLVQYFDKSRMEVNNPSGDRSSMWFVTNGLLVYEMVTGRMMVGDSVFEARGPAAEAVAGDWAAANPDCPTYGDFSGLIGVPAGSRVGQKVTATLAKGGAVREDPSKAGYNGTGNAYYEAATGHNIPQVLWEFMNRSGLIYGNGSYQNGQIVDWLFAFGYPISEPYWVRCKVAGEEKDILVQLFERRVLTYTPANPAGWQVEMGNVGMHYYTWRYGQ